MENSATCPGMGNESLDPEENIGGWEKNPMWANINYDKATLPNQCIGCVLHAPLCFIHNHTWA